MVNNGNNCFLLFYLGNKNSKSGQFCNWSFRFLLQILFIQSMFKSPFILNGRFCLFYLIRFFINLENVIATAFKIFTGLNLTAKRFTYDAVLFR